MKSLRRPLAFVLLSLVVCLILSGPAAGQASQEAPKAQPAPAKPAVAQPAGKPAAAEPAAETRPPVMSPKEKTGVYVFLAWTWLTIAVLLYVLTLKVRESDRVLRTGLYGAAGGGKEPGKT